MPSAQTLWHVEHRAHDGTVLDDIRPENLEFQLNKKPPHTIQYEMALSRPEIDHDFIGPYRTDFKLFYGDTPIMAGPHTGLEVAYGDDHCTIYGKDWFHLLERRQFPFDPRPHPPFTPTHVNDYVIGSPATGLAYEVATTDIATIVSALLDVVLARPDSIDITYAALAVDLGITTNFSLALADDSTMASIIDNLSQIDPGFMYEVTVDKELVFWTPVKYNILAIDDNTYADYIFDSSNSDSIEELTFMNNGPLATHLFGKGQGIGQQTYGSALGFGDAQDVYRRLDESIDVSDSTNRDQIIFRTASEFSRMLNPDHEVTLKVDPAKITDFWTLIQPGFGIWIDVDLIAHQIDSLQEILNMNCTVSTEGDALVEFGFQQAYTGTAGTAEG